jgi:membrane fusion protein (multidrug efflux system)
MKKASKILIYIVVILAIVAFILYPKLRSDKSAGSAAAAPRGDTKLPVDVKVVEPQAIENNIRISGAILANESIALRSEISGKIEQIFFEEGQRVQKGDLILSINDEEISAQVERLRFTQQLNEGIEYRQRQLLEKEAISREEYDIALTTSKTTSSDLKEREARLSKHKILAPFDGIIGLRQVSEGSYISPSDLVANLYSINPIKVEFAVPGKYTSLVDVGDRISFTVESTSKTFQGSIYATEPKIDPQTRTLKIRAICRNDKEELIPGQFASINYILDVLPDALMVPSEAVIPELNSHKVFVYKSGVVKQETVEIGLRTDKEVQLVSGISPGDTVIVTGILQVRQGMPVHINQVN